MTVRNTADLERTQRIVERPHLTPKINTTLQKLFTHVTALDLNIGY